MTGSGLGAFLLAAVGVVGLSVAAVRCEGTPPSVAAPEALAVGRAGRTVSLTVTDPGAGPKSLSAVLVHGQGEAPVGEAALGGGRWLPFGTPAPRTVDLAIDPKALGAREGAATLRVTARDHSFRRWGAGNETVLEIPLAIDFRAPAVAPDSGSIVYARRGGTVALAYRVSEATVRDGVELGERFFPGLRIGVEDPAELRAAGWRLALFPLPIDQPGAKPVLIAEDAAGNVGRFTPRVEIEERRLPEALLTMPPRFFQEKIPELALAVGVAADDPIAAFREINTRVRAENEAKIREITSTSTPTPLWDGAFEQMANSKVTSPFAEQRTYLVDGEKVSQSVHYGYDLASLAGAPVTASNAGRVVFADELGIYGQCVILDHGLGLFSLYAHLSGIEVAVGDEVAKGRTIGLSGQTGLAGGDHLHFAMLLAGHYVDPVEWWDGKWQRDRLLPKLAAARQ
jgi:murein DD-endopeptidase MepM/ murein hydrolase activator NlpD